MNIDIDIFPHPDLSLYPKTDLFTAADIIYQPHKYEFTELHENFVNLYHDGNLNLTSIVNAENTGIKCGHVGCTKPFSEHYYALLIQYVLPENQTLDYIDKEIIIYIDSIKEMAQKDKITQYVYSK